MIFIQHSLRISGSVLAMSYDGKDTIAVIDNGYNLYLFSKETLELQKRSQISSKYAIRHKYERSMATSNKLNIFISVPQRNSAHLLSATSGLKQVSQINSHTSPHTVAQFSQDGSILAVGDEAGMTILYKMPTGRVLTTLKKRADHISAIAFSNDNRYIAVSSFDKTTSIYDFESCKYIVTFTTDDVVECIVFSGNSNEINCVDRAKKIYKYTIDSGRLAHGDDNFVDWPTALINLGANHLLVGSRDDLIYLLSNDDLVIQQTIELPNYGVSSFLMIENLLFVGFSDGEIKIIDTEKNLSEFEITVTLNKFEQSTECITKNIFLVTNSLFSKYDEKWSEILMEAKDLITSGRHIDATKLAKPFFIDKNKEEEFRFCLGNAKHLAIFQKLVATKEYAKAMLVAEEKEFLKKTDEYKAVENAWYRAFQVAKELISENKPDSLEKAKNVLQKFSNVKSKLDAIYNLFTYSKAYIDAARLIREKNFGAYFALVRDNPFLESEDIYRRVLMIGSQTFDKMKKHEFDENIDDAIKIGEYLKSFLPIQSSVEKELTVLYAKKELLNKININDVAGAYSCVEAMPILENFRIFRTFHSIFIKAKNQALEEAQEANIRACISILKPYSGINYLAYAIFKTIKTAYISELEKALESETTADFIDWKSTYKAISSVIGSSDEVLILYKKYNLDENIEDEDIPEKETLDGSIELVDSIIKNLA